MRINNQTVAHVRPVASRAREGHGDTGSGVHFLCLRPVDECRCDGDPHTLEGHNAIVAELVACTLGARRRPELHAVAYAEGGIVTRREPLPVR